MEVRLFDNTRRPGVGRRPRREAQRPLLPQHARHCPVLEAGSALGLLVYPPLEPQESFHISYQGNGQYRTVYYIQAAGDGRWQPIFSLVMTMPIGSVGMMTEDLKFLIEDPPITREDALALARTFIVPADLGTPPGAISLRGATNFQTPPGWDTVYAPVLNMVDRPRAPMLVVRVETDWFAHETEFRYVLEPSEGIPGSHNTPIGQVFFVPREEVTWRDCTEEELAAIRQSMEEFSREKAALRQTTALGLDHSPLYQRRSRSQKA